MTTAWRSPCGVHEYRGRAPRVCPICAAAHDDIASWPLVVTNQGGRPVTRTAKQRAHIDAQRKKRWRRRKALNAA